MSLPNFNTIEQCAAVTAIHRFDSVHFYVTLPGIFPSKPNRTKVGKGMITCAVTVCLVNGTPQFLDPQKSETCEPIDVKLDRGDYVANLTAHANLNERGGGDSALRVKLSSSVSIFNPPLLFLANVNSRVSCVIARPSVCLTSVTFVHPTQAIEIFGNVFRPFGTLAICWHPGKFYGDRTRGTPPSGTQRGSWI